MSEVIVASTTDTQADINAAAGADIEEQEKPVEGEEPEEGEKKPEPDANKKAVAEKRIARLTREGKQKDAAFAELSARMAKLENGGQAPVKPQAVETKADEPSPKPKPDQFADYEEYTEALADWKFDQRIAKMETAAKAEEDKKAVEAARTNVVNAWNESVKEAMERYDDFEEIVNRNAQIPEVVGSAIVEGGMTDVAYFLGQNPAMCKELMKMTPIQALVKLGEIQHELAPMEATSTEGAPAPKIKTRAGEPIRPVAGHSTKSTVPVDELPYSEYRKIRDRQEKERFRR